MKSTMRKRKSRKKYSHIKQSNKHYKKIKNTNKSKKEGKYLGIEKRCHLMRAEMAYQIEMQII